MVGTGDFLGCTTGDDHGFVGQARLVHQEQGALPLVELKRAHRND